MSKVARRPASADGVRSPGRAGRTRQVGAAVFTVQTQVRRPTTAGSVPRTRRQTRKEERAQRLRHGEGFGFKLDHNRQERKHLINGANQLLAEAAIIQAKANATTEMEQRPWKAALLRTSSPASQAELQTQLGRVATDRWVADQIVQLRTEVTLLRDTLHAMGTLDHRVRRTEAAIDELRDQLESGQFGLGGAVASPQQIKQKEEAAQRVTEARAKIHEAQRNARKQDKKIKRYEREVEAAINKREDMVVRAKTRYKISKNDGLVAELKKDHGASDWGSKTCPGLPECNCTNGSCCETADQILIFVEGFKEDYPNFSHLHDDDLAAARVYTNKTVPIFSQLNAALRTGELPADTPPDRFKCMYYHLKNAVTHLPGVQDWHECFWRGQPMFFDNPQEGQEDGHSYGIGMTVTWASFTSISTDEKIARSFAAGGVLFKMVSMQPNFGAAFQPLSVFREEEEILIPPGSSFRVLSLEMDKASATKVVTMEHVGLWALPEHAQLKENDEELAKPPTALRAGEEIPLSELHSLITEARTVHAEMLQAIKDAQREHLELVGGAGVALGISEGAGGVDTTEFDRLAMEVEEMQEEAEEREEYFEKQLQAQSEQYERDIKQLSGRLVESESRNKAKTQELDSAQTKTEKLLLRHEHDLQYMVRSDENEEKLRQLTDEIKLLERHALSQAAGGKKTSTLKRLSSAVNKTKNTISSDTPAAKTKHSLDRGEDVCYHCMGIGHWKQDCPFGEYLPEVARKKAMTDTIIVRQLESKVSGIDAIENQDNIADVFSQFGEVIAVTLRVRRKPDADAVSWALVTMESHEEAVAACKGAPSLDVSKRALECEMFDMAMAMKSDGAMRKVILPT